MQKKQKSNKQRDNKYDRVLQESLYCAKMF